jgi:hypothetical protein
MEEAGGRISMLMGCASAVPDTDFRLSPCASTIKSSNLVLVRSYLILM